MKPTREKLLALPAMARHLNVKPRDLRAAVETGDIPAIRVGESLLFSAREVEASLLERARGIAEGVRGED